MAIPEDSGEFIKVFDVLDSGFRTLPFSVIVFCIAGLIATALFVPKKREKKSPPPASWMQVLMKRRSFARWYGYGALVFLTIMAISTFVTSLRKHMRYVALLQNRSCRLVEGPVEQFRPLIPRPHTCTYKSFYVQGVHFRYSDSVASDAFNTSSYYGGPINKDSYVRICYDPEGNAILRLEIRK